MTFDNNTLLFIVSLLNLIIAILAFWFDNVDDTKRKKINRRILSSFFLVIAIIFGILWIKHTMAVEPINFQTTNMPIFIATKITLMPPTKISSYPITNTQQVIILSSTPLQIINPPPTSTQQLGGHKLPASTKILSTNNSISPTPGPIWPIGDPYIQCDRVNVSLYNDSHTLVDTSREMKDKDGNVVGLNNDPIQPGQYANLGWSGNPPPGYIGSVSWEIKFYDPSSNTLLHNYADSKNLNCQTPTPTSAPTPKSAPTPTSAPNPTSAPKWPIGGPYIKCDRVNVSLLNDSQKTVDSSREMKDKDGNIVGANYDPVPVDQYANLGWSGNPPKGYVGTVSWIISFSDPSNGMVLYTYADSAFLNCQ
ncbi:MAG: hypothetical protein P4L50_23620 [Anaerolineaceae bacterium]|nr:hypothetical protein [Anaerolineaceae bacterium]